MKSLTIFADQSLFKRLAVAAGLLSLLSLAGCAGPPAQNYTLSSGINMPSAQPLVTTSAKDRAGLYVLSDISVPAEADNLSLVVRQGDGRLLVLSDDRWTGSLSSQLSTAISQALTQRLGMPPVQKLSADASSSAVTKIQLDVQRFDLVPGQYVALDVVWTVRTPNSKTFLTCFTRLRQSVGVGVLPLVQGQQANVQALADQLAQVLLNRNASPESNCTRQ